MALGAAAAVLLTRPKDNTVATSPTAENQPAKSTTTAKPPSLPPDETSTTTPTTSVDSNTTTTSMSSTDGSSITGIVYLSDMDPVDSEGDVQAGNVTVNGEIHTRSKILRPYDSPAFMEFDAGRHYKTLKGTLGLPDDAPSDASMRVEIFGDNQPLFNQDIGLGQAIPIDLPVTNVLRLRLQVTKLSGSSSSSAAARVAFADMRLE